MGFLDKIFGEPAPVEPVKPPHYVDTYGAKGAAWNFSFDSKDEALVFLDEVIEAINNGTTIRRGTAVLNGKMVTAAKYRDYHRTYYF